MQKAVVIVAGGAGLRMGAELPKQFLPLGGLPILFRTLQRFFECSEQLQLIVVAPSNHFETIQNLKKEFQFNIPFRLTEGGATRFLSVKNGLALVEAHLVGIHDAVRPLVSNKTIDTAFKIASEKGNAIPAVPVVDSLREVKENSNSAVNRGTFKIIQTPQVFKTELIKKAFATAKGNNFSDDATVLESYGHSINLTEGNRENIKITTPADLKIAEALFSEL